MGNAALVMKDARNEAFSSVDPADADNTGAPVSTGGLTVEHVDRASRIALIRTAMLGLPASARMDRDCVGNDDEELQSCLTTRGIFPVQAPTIPLEDIVSTTRTAGTGLTTVV